MSLIIDPEFQALCPPLLPEEREQLAASLLAEGCRDPLVVWLPTEHAWCETCEAEQPIENFFARHPFHEEDADAEYFWLCTTCRMPINEEELEPILLDGHNRYTLCQQHQIPFALHYHGQIESREEAINWIIANQLGRRNLTEEQKSYLRGKRYQSEKRQDGRPEKRSKNDNVSGRTEARLAQEYRVSPATIQNDSKFATALDTLESQVRQDIRETVLRRQDRDQGRITKQQVTATGKLVQEHAVISQPFMRREGWKPYQVLEAIEVLGTVPQDEHAALNALLDQPFIPATDGLAMLKNLEAMPREARQGIYRLQASSDPRDRSDAKTLAARIPPEPDPQLSYANKLIAETKALRDYQRKNWREKFKEEPWTEDLDAIDALLEEVQARWRQIAVRVKTHQTERQARYAITITAG